MPEVLIAGGGPAGSAAARLLALWGHDVRLIAPSAAVEGTLAESLPPSCGKLFDVLGVRDRVEAAGFVRSTGNTVWWGESAPRVEMFAASERGWQVARHDFAALLLQAAREAGVRAEVGRVTADQLDSAAEPVILDCTGRRGVVARARRWRRHEPALRTVALVGAWRRDTWEIPDRTHTLIESYADGWTWSVPLAGGDRSVAVMVDPKTTDLAKAASSRAVYLGELAKTHRLARLLDDATFLDGPVGWDASMYSSDTYADHRTLLVGDAASFIDPLSSAGVKKALASGWLAAVAAHTALGRPAMREIAFGFFSAREREVYDGFRALTERFLSAAAAGHAHPFWDDRAFEAATADASHARHEDTAVQAAFDRLRAAPALRVRRSDDIRVEPRPAVSGCEIVLEPRLVTSEVPQGIRYLHDVDLVTVLELAPACGDVGVLFERYVRRSGPLALPDFLRALSTLVARGWLVDVDR